jgi:hypothetical protein
MCGDIVKIQQTHIGRLEAQRNKSACSPQNGPVTPKAWSPLLTTQLPT